MNATKGVGAYLILSGLLTIGWSALTLRQSVASQGAYTYVVVPLVLFAAICVAVGYGLLRKAAWASPLLHPLLLVQVLSVSVPGLAVELQGALGILFSVDSNADTTVAFSAESSLRLAVGHHPPPYFVSINLVAVGLLLWLRLERTRALPADKGARAG